MPRAKPNVVKCPHTVVTPDGVTYTIVPIGGVKGTVPEIDPTTTRVWHIVFNRELGLWEYGKPSVVADPASRDVLAAILAEGITAAVVAELSGSAARIPRP